MTSNSNALPVGLYESLLLKLVTVLELTQTPEGTATPQAKQALLQATNDFKNAMSQARELAIALPGGELFTGEQDEVIDMLQQLKDRKREQLLQFSRRILSSGLTAVDDNQMEIDSMEIDSMASTPNNS